MDNVDKFVDEVYDELLALYEKDKNSNKSLLGNDPILHIFNAYSDWIANNLALTPKVAANALYKDVIGVGYLDFDRRKLKRGVQLRGESSFNLIFGNQKEIDDAAKLMNKLKTDNPKKHQLVTTALEKIKGMADTIKPQKNLFGKTTNVAKQDVANVNRMPRYNTLLTLLKMNESQLSGYIKKFDDVITKAK